MKKHLLITVVFLFSFACGATEKKIVTEVIDPYYQPKKIYSVGFEKAWESTLNMLAEDRVPIQTVNKEEGLIRTDFQLTPEGSRYNFNIKILPGPEENTLIQIHCFYEIRDTKDQFRDYTYSSPRQVASLENGVYRRIESTLFIQEKQKETGEAEPGKMVKDPSPGPASAKAEAPAIQPEKAPPSPGAPAAETAKEVPPGQPFITYWTTKKTAILMREPSDDGPLLMALKKGTAVERMGQSGSWLKVRVPSGEIGWLPIDGLQIAPLADTAKGADKPAPIKQEPLPFPEAKPQAAPPKPAADEKIPALFLSTTKNVNLREGPSTHSKIITILRQGERVEKIGESVEFAKVRLPEGGTGWVANQFLQETSSPPQSKATFLVTKDKAPLRENPSPQGKTISILKKGRQVEKIGKSGVWTKVKLPWRQEGWLEDHLLTNAK